MTRPTPARALVPLLAIAVLVVLLWPATASAHPLGNFTTNTSATVLPGPDATEVVYVLDLAEIPTQRAGEDLEAAGSPEAWAAQTCEDIADAQELVVEGTARPLDVDAAGITFPPGEAGLDTLRLTCELSATADLPDPARLTYADDYVSGRTGWREVIAAGDGTTLRESDVPAASITSQLREYPEAEISRTTTAALVVDPTAGDPAPAGLRATGTQPVADEVGGLEGLVRSYTDLISRQDLTVGFVLLALVLAIALGTAHAVAPGHGKTVIAAYLLGEGGQARQAVALGGTVAITHTIGVLVLGLVVQTSTSLAPESLYPILGVAGGVIFTGLGCLLLYRALTRRGHGHDHDHDHAHGHDHAHAPVALAVGGGAPAHGVHVTHDHTTHDHTTHDHHDHQDRGPRTTWRMLVLPGLAGGMVPSPSALLVLLGGIALDRTWFGVLLVLAYGVGMALALVGAGYLLHRVRFRLMDRLEGRTWARVSTALPIATSSLIVVGGLVIVARSLLTA